MVTLKADDRAQGRNMQHTDSSIEYTVVLDDDVTVGWFVCWLVETQRDDTHGDEASEIL